MADTTTGSPTPQQPTSQQATSSDKPVDVGVLDVHAMPEKFLGVRPGKPVKKQSRRSMRKSPQQPASSSAANADPHKLEQPKKTTKRHVLIAVAIVVGLGGFMAAAAYYFVQNFGQDDEVSEPVVVPGITTEPVVTAPPAPTSLPTETPPETPDPVVTTVPPTTPVTPIATTPPPPPSTPVTTPPETAVPDEPFIDPELLDTDEDLLTVEEERLFGTTDTSFDFDGDGFIDGQEVLNMFDPRFGDGALLGDSTSVKMFVSTDQGYRMLVPTSWSESRGASPAITRFGSNSIVAQEGAGEFVEVSVENNTNGHGSLEEWYAARFPGASLDLLSSVPGKDITGLMRGDGFAVFFLTPTRIYTLTYTPSVDSNVYFQTVFNMMARSFSVFEVTL